MLQQDFKKYARGKRVQFTEDNFGKGMSYTNSPLPEGFSKMLINYDYKDEGDMLIPRPGLRTYKLALPPKHNLSGSAVVNYSTSMSLVAGKTCTELDNREYNQILIGQVTDETFSGTDLYKGDLFVDTIYPNGESYEGNDELPDALIPGIESVESHIEPLLLEGDYAIFKKPKKAEIHKMQLQDLDPIARHVGTFAFNNNYYFFRRRDDGTVKLCYTKLTERDATGFHAYKPYEIVPRTLTPKEAVMWGYNMLSSNPYNFTNELIADSVVFHGMLPYDANDKLMMSPQINQNIILKCFYGAGLGLKISFVWEWKEAGADTWVSLGEDTRTITAADPLTKTFSSPAQNVMVRITAYKWNGEVKDTVPLQVLTVGFNFSKEVYGSTANVATKTYDLSTCAGMTYWKNRLVFYGVDSTLLFMSDVNNPEYVPYPNGTELFDEPIRYAMPFLDNLLVFTSTQLHMLTLNADGLSWTKKCIQSNLYIQEWDVHLIKAVKNMVFFKSGNYYYMVVPSKASTTGDLTVAPISKMIEPLLDNFQKSVDELLDFMYYYRDGVELVHYYNFLDYEDVHNVYMFKTSRVGTFVNLSLLYNISTRSWRAYLFESDNVVVPFRQDATKKGVLMSLVPVLISERLYPTLQYIQYDKANVADFYLLQVAAGAEDPVELFKTAHFFRNYQLLDTGYREHASDFKKRYRELQFKLNNVSQETLRFYTDFMIDGELRKTISKYEMYHELDPEDPNYGLITMERVYVDPLLAPGVTILAESEEDINCWQLDLSMFPEAVLWKIRVPISGKGFAPRMRLISFNECPYEILSTAWVHRQLNSR